MNEESKQDAEVQEESFLAEEERELTIEEQLARRYREISGEPEPTEEEAAPETSSEADRYYDRYSEDREIEEAKEDEATPQTEVDQGEEGFLGGMRLSQKFVVLGFVGFIMLSIPFGVQVYNSYKEIKYAKNEILGIDPIKEIIKIVQSTQQHRAFATKALNGNADSANSRFIKAKEIAENIPVVDALLTQQVGNPSIFKDWTTAKSNWDELAGNIKSGKINAQESLVAHDELLKEYYNIIDRIADHHGLPTDPEAITSYAARAGVYLLPKLVEALERTSDIGTELLTTKNPDPTTMAIMNSYYSLAKSTNSETFGQLQKSLDVDLKFRDRLQSMATKAENKLEKTLSTTEAEIVNKPALSFDATEFSEDMRNSIIGLNVLNMSLFDELKVLLQNRNERLIKQLLSIAGGILAFSLAGLYIAYQVARSITEPMDQLVGVMRQLAAGDATVRANMSGRDEIGLMARQFDTMVDQREAANAKIKEENETLNNSIINLLEAVAGLAQRDLTIKAPVAEDITGPVGDALNYLSDETAKVLNQVTRIAEDVAKVSQQVKAQADTVIEIAGEENREVERSAAELNAASEVMLDIAQLALSCNEAATKAIQKTDRAQVTVLSTVQGITSIRDTIRETEKRIKRLGERSQEIGSVITIINGIAERTHILALNASMHAASAGEAGKGFAVVANEVQKLAENAREATMQISNLVNNIQVETAETVTTMNEAITQVVEGTTLAQQAGSEMRETRETTAELVQLVQRIAENSRAQAETTQKIRERSMLIQKSSAETFQQLKDQGKQTERLVAFSGNLVQSVGVFTLPKTEESRVQRAEAA